MGSIGALALARTGPVNYHTVAVVTFGAGFAEVRVRDWSFILSSASLATSGPHVRAIDRGADWVSAVFLRSHRRSHHPVWVEVSWRDGVGRSLRPPRRRN